MGPAGRYETGALAAWMGIIINLLLAVAKGITGVLAGSTALLADAFHSASDILASMVVLVGLKISCKPADKDHPYGHGKAEAIAAKIVGIIIILAGINIAYSSINAFIRGVESSPSISALVVALLSVIIKEGMFQYVYRQGKRISSKALLANAYEHRNDALSSIAVLVGIGGALFGDYFAFPQMYYLDPAAGLAVSVLILRMGFEIAREAARDLMDSSIGDDNIEDLSMLVLQVDGVRELHELRARLTGHQYCVDVEIGVDENISVKEGHDVAFQVKEKLLKEKENVLDVLVHVNPCRRDEQALKFPAKQEKKHETAK